MKIAHLRIHDVLGIEHLEFEAGAFNTIAGRNGQGKTSVLEAIKALCNGGEDATLLRKGAEAGEIVLVMDDGTELKRRITPKGSYSTVKEADGSQAGKPGARIKSLVDRISINPVEFLGADPKRRVDVLLDSLPIKADPARLAEMVAPMKVKYPEDAPALTQIDTIYKVIFDERTGTNRAIKEKDATINQLAATMPPEDASAPEGGIGELETQLAQLDSVKDTELTRIAEKLEGLRLASQGRVDEIQGEIDGLLQQVELKRTIINSERNAFAEISGKAGIQRQATIDTNSAQRKPLVERIAVIRANAEAVARAAQTADTIKVMRAEAATLLEDQEQQTAALTKLQAYKLELLKSLPIDGLSVEDGQILRHGVVFDRLNTQQKVEIAVEIAKLRAGELRVICVDGIELLDSDNFAAFRDRALESDLQLFVTHVTDGDFAMSAQG